MDDFNSDFTPMPDFDPPAEADTAPVTTVPVPPVQPGAETPAVPPQAPPYAGIYPPPFAPQQAPAPTPYPYPGGAYYYPYPQPQPQGYPAPVPGPAYTPPQKKKGGALRIIGILLGSAAGIVLFAFSVVLLNNIIQKENPRSTYSAPAAPYSNPNPFDGDGSSQPNFPGGDKNLTPPSAASAPEVDIKENTDPNGPELRIYGLPADVSTTLTVKQIAQKLAPSVASVRVYYKDGEPSPSSLIGEGTAIVMTADGYLLTNSHVVLDYYARQRIIMITLADGRELEAKVVGVDPRTDLAVLKLNVNNLTPAEFGDSGKLEVGDQLVAIGNGGGIRFAGSVTTGIVSALGRQIDSELEGAMQYIQTDAAINPGNSGGPLINPYGQVIGVNTAKFTGDFEGMGFAIPSADVKPVVDSLIKSGFVTGRARLGITCRESDYGYEVVIEEISSESGFADTEAKSGDVIIELDGQEIYSLSDLFAVISTHKPGDIVKAKLGRGGVIRRQPFPGASSSPSDSDDGTITVSVRLLEDKGETQAAPIEEIPNDYEFPIE